MASLGCPLEASGFEPEDVAFGMLVSCPIPHPRKGLHEMKHTSRLQSKNRLGSGSWANVPIGNKSTSLSWSTFFNAFAELGGDAFVFGHGLWVAKDSTELASEADQQASPSAFAGAPLQPGSWLGNTARGGQDSATKWTLNGSFVGFNILQP